MSRRRPAPSLGSSIPPALMNGRGRGVWPIDGPLVDPVAAPDACGAVPGDGDGSAGCAVWKGRYQTRAAVMRKLGERPRPHPARIEGGDLGQCSIISLFPARSLTRARRGARTSSDLIDRKNHAFARRPYTGARDVMGISSLRGPTCADFRSWHRPPPNQDRSRASRIASVGRSSFGAGTALIQKDGLRIRSAPGVNIAGQSHAGSVHMMTNAVGNRAGLFQSGGHVVDVLIVSL
jgi:hypothetical protein